MNTIDRKHIIQEIKQLLLPILIKHGVSKAALFGSVARGEAAVNSDVDLLVDFGVGKKKTLLDLIQLETDVETGLGRRADVVTYDGLHPLLRKQVIHEQVIILET